MKASPSTPSVGDKRILIIGVGNPLRSDDGVGAYVIDTIGQKHTPSVKAVATQQLHLEILEEAVSYEVVVFVDAASQKEDLIFEKVEVSNSTPLVSSHHLSHETFLLLAKKLYHKNLNLILCSIRGENFDFGEKISPVVLNTAKRAIGLLNDLIKEKTLCTNGNSPNKS